MIIFDESASTDSKILDIYQRESQCKAIVCVCNSYEHSLDKTRVKAANIKTWVLIGMYEKSG
jgi:hypothetical protein